MATSKIQAMLHRKNAEEIISWWEQRFQGLQTIKSIRANWRLQQSWSHLEAVNSRSWAVGKLFTLKSLECFTNILLSSKFMGKYIFPWKQRWKKPQTSSYPSILTKNKELKIPSIGILSKWNWHPDTISAHVRAEYVWQQEYWNSFLHIKLYFWSLNIVN